MWIYWHTEFNWLKLHHEFIWKLKRYESPEYFGSNCFLWNTGESYLWFAKAWWNCRQGRRNWRGQGGACPSRFKQISLTLSEPGGHIMLPHYNCSILGPSYFQNFRHPWQVKMTHNEEPLILFRNVASYRECHVTYQLKISSGYVLRFLIGPKRQNYLRTNQKPQITEEI